MAVVTVNLIIFLAVVIGLLFLEAFLAKLESKWPGLILPGLGLVYSLVVLFNYAAYPGETVMHIIGGLLGAFFSANIFTAIFLIVYFIARTRRRERENIDRMNKQDLG